VIERAFTVVVERDRESDWLLGEKGELPGCYTQATDVASLARNIHEATVAWLQSAEPDEPAPEFGCTWRVAIRARVACGIMKHHYPVVMLAFSLWRAGARRCAMARTVERTEPGARILAPTERRVFFDEQAHALLGLTGADFLQRWDAGEFAEALEDPDRPELLQLAMLIPFGR
jgi:predicted RNase H-like HicB family nuclease